MLPFSAVLFREISVDGWDTGHGDSGTRVREEAPFFFRAVVHQNVVSLLLKVVQRCSNSNSSAAAAGFPLTAGIYRTSHASGRYSWLSS